LATAVDSWTPFMRAADVSAVGCHALQTLGVLHLLLLAVVTPDCVRAVRPAVKVRKSRPGALSMTSPERFNEQFSHLHVHPSSHRMILNRGDEVPTLVVTFAIRSHAKTLQFTLPSGYEPVPLPDWPNSCGVVVPANGANSSVYSRSLHAQPLAEHISDCELSSFEKTRPVRLTLHLCEGVTGLSAMPRLARGEDAVPLSWWVFHLRAWSPEISPATEDNVFELRWSEDEQATDGWTGSELFEGWPVLGDWNCVYSDWEGWGTCSARCGGGIQRLTRRILMQPPLGGTGKSCSEDLIMDIECNRHPCLWPCEFVEEQRSGCSSECGGGVQLVRMRWRGEQCPVIDDEDAIRREPCNTQPCRVKCLLEDTWRPVTECSEACGLGHFWLMRPVLQKEQDDINCAPEWQQLPCVRQHCQPLSVVRPDRNLIAFPNGEFTAAVIFKVPLLSRLIHLNAPEGFRFGTKGQDCLLTEHDMIPHFEKCTVGVRSSQAVLSFNTPLTPTLASSAESASAMWLAGASHGGSEGIVFGYQSAGFEDRHSFKIQVVNPPCPNENWAPDLMRTALVCDFGEDGNRWTMEFAEEGTTRWESASSQGYPIYAPDSLQVTLWNQGLVGKKGQQDWNKALVAPPETSEGGKHMEETDNAQMNTGGKKSEDATDAQNAQESSTGEQDKLAQSQSKDKLRQSLHGKSAWEQLAEKSKFCSARIPCETGTHCSLDGICVSD